jgi:cysteine-rich repeat protein
MCVAGACGGQSATCGDGILQSGCNEECDDGNNVSGDGCSATCQLEFGCLSTPDTGCRVPGATAAAQVLIADKTPDSKDRMQFKWGKGQATTVADFGTPLATTDYALCITTKPLWS